MKFILEEAEVKEIKPLEESSDKGLVINPTVGKRDEGKANLVKEIVGMDALMIGPKEAARIHGVPESSASKYSRGEDIKDEETRLSLLSKKYDIQDTAITKLMETLNLLDPDDIVKPRDKIAVITGLATVVEKMNDKGAKDGSNTSVQLHFYAPNQKKETDYTIIEA